MTIILRKFIKKVNFCELLTNIYVVTGDIFVVTVNSIFVVTVCTIYVVTVTDIFVVVRSH